MTHTYWTCAFLADDCSSAFAQWESLHFLLQSSMIEGRGETGATRRPPEQLAFFLLMVQTAYMKEGSSK